MNQTKIAQNIEANDIAADLHHEAYEDGAFYAETDWQCNRKRPGFLWGPDSMAEHCAVVWGFVASAVCPEWNTEHHRLSFFIGYEDRATEFADAGEAGYEALAEAGSVAETDGWVVQSEPWSERATPAEKELRAVAAASRGSKVRAERYRETGSADDRRAADEAAIRATVALAGIKVRKEGTH